MSGTAASHDLGRKPVDAWWTVIAIDPLAVRVLPRLVRITRITPNVLTTSSGIVGLAAGAFFWWGIPVLGAVLFELRFFLDCLDGKVARMRGLKSAFGAFYDRQTDMLTTWWSFGALGAWLLREGSMPAALCLLPLLLVVTWSWSNEQLIRMGGPDPDAPVAPEPGSTGFRARMAQHRLTALPGSVEAETAVLFLAPLTTSPIICAIVLWSVTGLFYVVSTLRNCAGLARTLRVRDRSAA